MALEFMTRYSGPGYHPAVRYNATMILGDLNVQEFPPGTKTPVQPHPGAFKVLAAAVRDSDSDAVRVAALLSLTRHASQAPAGSPIADQLTPMLVGLVKSPPPPGRSAEGHAWLRALAIEVLAALHSVGPNGSVVGLLVGIVGDKSAPVLTRCAAARALGTFDYTDFKGLTAGQLATPLGQLAVEMCTAELARARAGAKAAAKSGSKAMGPGMGPMMMPGGPMSMPMSAPTGGMRGASTPGMSPMPGMGASMYAGPGGQQPAEDEESADRMLRFRRNLKFYLNAARLGLNGPLDSQNGAIRRYAAKNEADPKKLADSQDPEWKFVNEVFTQIQQQIKILDKEEEKLQLIANELTNSRNKLRELLKTGSTTPSPAADKGPAKK
jgi:hypothetical protein